MLSQDNTIFCGRLLNADNLNLYYFENAYLVFLWACYLGRMLWDNEFLLKWYRIVYFISLFANCLIVLVNFFAPVMFRLENDGSFTAIPVAMWIYTIFNYISAAIPTISLILHRRRLRPDNFLPLLLYPIFPSVGEILQLVLQNVDMVSFYALSAFLVYKVEYRNEILRDPLTGIGNRFLLENKLTRWLSRYRRLYICGIMLDIDDLKQINDTYGHPAGDEAIMRVVNILNDVPNRSITIIRYAGDEFVLLWQTETPSEAEDIMRYLHTAESTMNRNAPADQTLHFSLGSITVAPETNISVSDFLWMLDQKMYDNKQAINRTISYALQHNTLYLEYQPIWSVSAKRFIAAEALLRLKDENGVPVPPTQFIPAAEKTGAIYQLERFVLDSVCRFVSEHELSSLGLDYISINLSTIQSARSSMANTIIQTISAAGIPSSSICLELTETALAANRQSLADNLDALSAAGVRLIMDDFGSGYSNLRRLARLPVNTVKIDRSLTAAEDARSFSIFRLSAKMLRELNLNIIVEGVETAAQAERMYSMNLDLLQGFYYARPMGEDKLISLLSSIERHSDR